VFAVGLFQVGAPVKAGLETVVFPHFTVGCVIAVPAIPVAAKPVQVRAVEEADGAALTVKVPQLTVLFPPQFAVAVTLNVPATGLLQLGALAKVAEALSPLHFTVGCEIAVPATPV